MTPLQTSALNLLDLLDKRITAYWKLNVQVRNLQGELPSNLQFIDHKLEQPLFDLLDEILGDKIADYYLNECPKKDGKRDGVMLDSGSRRSLIRNIKDVKAFVERKRT